MNYEPLDVKLKRVVDDLDPRPSVPAQLATARETFVASSPVARQTVEERAAIENPSAAGPGDRDLHGRFTQGCKPGPGRPRRPQQRSHIEDGWLYIWCMEFEKARLAWSGLVQRMGPGEARKYLTEIEAEHGPIKFRGLALEYIAAAEAKPPEVKPAERQPSRRKRAAKKGRKRRSGRKITTESRRAR